MSLLCSLGGFLHFGTLEATAEKEERGRQRCLSASTHSLTHSSDAANAAAAASVAAAAFPPPPPLTESRALTQDSLKKSRIH